MASIHLTYGAFFNGVLVSVVLFGVTCGQAIQYYRSYTKDSMRLKMLVAGTWTMDALHSVLLAHSLWHYLIARVPEEELHKANWSLISQVVPTEIIAVTVDCFFINRIWIMSDKDWRALLLIIPTFLALGVSFAYVEKCFRLPFFVDGTKSTWLLGLFSSCRAFVDIAIAVSMCYLLFQRKSGFRRTQSLVKQLIRYTVATGALTSLITTVYISTFFTMQTNFVYIGVYLVHGKIYLNSMLAALNGRRALRETANVEINLSDYSSGSTSADTSSGMVHSSSEDPTVKSALKRGSFYSTV